MTRDIIYDVAVIGGGPAGMIASIRAAELGASVVLIKKNNRPVPCCQPIPIQREGCIIERQYPVFRILYLVY